jgi:hypothetical protein
MAARAEELALVVLQFVAAARTPTPRFVPGAARLAVGCRSGFRPGRGSGFAAAHFGKHAPRLAREAARGKAALRLRFWAFAQGGAVERWKRRNGKASDAATERGAPR